MIILEASILWLGYPPPPMYVYNDNDSHGCEQLSLVILQLMVRWYSNDNDDIDTNKEFTRLIIIMANNKAIEELSQ